MRNKGMSLVEIIVVVAVMSVLIGVMGYGLSLSSGKPAEECARKLVSEIQQARMAAMGKNRTAITIRADNGGQDGVWVDLKSWTVADDGSTVEQPVETKKVGSKVNIDCNDLTLEFDRASGALVGETGVVEIHISKANTKKKIVI